MKKYIFNWIRSPWYDLLFILSPPFVCLFIIAFFPALFKASAINSEWVWLFLIVGIDVGHVYATIYRTYLDKASIHKNKLLFYLSPLLIYITGVLLHTIDAICFWRCMAYLAVFHFIRQQYGFMRLYTRGEIKSPFQLIDNITIYAATIYPLLYWHLQGKQVFNWFVENDFFYLNLPELVPYLTTAYYIIVGVYAVKEIISIVRNNPFNMPKNLLMLGTLLSWYFGIVYYKGDLTFTLLNVVSHGIPYYALVWAHGNKRHNLESNSTNWFSRLFKPVNVIFFLAILLLLAYSEELLWDGFVWQEHFQIFPTSYWLPNLTDSKTVMSLLIPLLALPQLLHYFIDGFIWKIRKDNFGWSKVLLHNRKS